MALCETKVIGTGKNSIVVNKEDYDKGFPLNPNIKAKVKEIEASAKAEADKKANAKKKEEAAKK